MLQRGGLRLHLAQLLEFGPAKLDLGQTVGPKANRGLEAAALAGDVKRAEDHSIVRLFLIDFSAAMLGILALFDAKLRRATVLAYSLVRRMAQVFVA